MRPLEPPARPPTLRALAFNHLPLPRATSLCRHPSQPTPITLRHNNTPAGKELAPVDERLLTQQGGVLVFEGSTTMYKHSDAGILRIADVEEVLAAALPAGAATEALPAQVQRGLMG